jgi:hypothetical protein
MKYEVRVYKTDDGDWAVVGCSGFEYRQWFDIKAEALQDQKDIEQFMNKRKGYVEPSQATVK